MKYIIVEFFHPIIQKNFRMKEFVYVIKFKRMNLLILIYFITISSYSRVPRPILSACSRHVRHSDSGVEFVK